MTVALKRLSIFVALLACGWLALLCAVAQAQSVTVNYGSTTGAVTPNLFGVNHAVTSGSVLTNTLGVGVTIAREDYYMSDIVPSTTLSAYQAALAAGCTSGSVCDPSTWNWSRTDGMQALRTAGMKVMGIMDYNVPFDSNNGTLSGTVIDYTVYDDIVAKIVAHFTADYVEIGNEPDGCQFMCLDPTDYATHYAHVAGAIRGVSSTVPIGGPATSIPGHTDYVNAMAANTNILPGWVNFISQHSYTGSFTNNFDTSMLTDAKTYWPSVIGWTDEWNYDSGCTSSLDNDDPSSVGWFGANLIAAINSGLNSMYYNADESPSSGGCAWIDTSNNLLPKDYAYEVLKQIGLNTGTGAVKSTTFSGITEAAGAVNSAGYPVIALANWFTPLNVTVTLNNLSLSGTVSVTIYMADFSANNGTTPFNTFDVTVSGGSTTFTVPMTADSVAGVILGASVGTPTLLRLHGRQPRPQHQLQRLDTFGPIVYDRVYA